MQLNSLRELAVILGLIFVTQIILVLVLVLVRKIRKFRRRLSGKYDYPWVEMPELFEDRHALTLYMCGEKLFPAMLSAIEAAQHTIMLESFIWKGDKLGQQFKQALVRKANQGVKVYVIFDGFANLVVPRAFKRFPPAINVLKYPAFPYPSQWFDFRAYARDHRKLLVVDHDTAFIGGYNIGDLYHTDWRDTHLRVIGPVARNLAEMFASFWNRNRRHLPRLEIDLDLEWQSTIRVQRNDASRMVFPIRSMYLDAIERAERYVYITNAYFIPDRAILESLVSTARRGVDVRILVPYESNHVVADWLVRHYFEFCLRNGIRIFTYRHTMNHAKTATIDGIWSTVGTANLDRLSLAGNHEINLEIYNPALAVQMEQIFLCDLSNADELELAAWAQRPWYAKAAELVLSPLWPIL